ncbi:MAG TPA: ADOP family duplicated permease [Thermoanaerobaculia bacterium]|nr:ADOP family duplicated permease [Thermoanaerobaculia bacterium]
MGRKARSPLWRLPVAEEVREELDFHLEMCTRELIAEGWSEAEAQRRAGERMGDLEALGTACRRAARRRDRRFRFADLAAEVTGDARFAWRQWARRPAFSASLVLVLALGIAANVAAFSLVDRTLLVPPPYADAGRLVTLWEAQPAASKAKNVVSPANFIAWSEEARSFEAMTGFLTVDATLAGDGEPLRTPLRYVTRGHFQILERPTAAGRPLGDGDFEPDAPGVVVISDGLWQRRWARSPEVVGRTVEIDGSEVEVVGVMPPGGLDMGLAFSPYGDAPDVWAPMAIPEAWRQPSGRWMMVVARLAPGVTAAAAQTEMDGLGERLRDRFPDFNEGWAFRVVPLTDHLAADSRLPLLTLLGAVALVLLIAGFNTAALLLARTAGRRDEVAVRRALGAGPWRLARQMLTEGALLASTAGAVGLLLGGFALQLAVPLLPAHLAPREAPGVGTEALLLTALLVLLATLLFGLLPAAYAARRRSGRATGAGVVGRRRRLLAAFVFVETAVAVVLLAGAGLLLRSTWNLLQVDPGFDRSGVAALSTRLPNDAEPARVDRTWGEIVEQVAALPGVEHAGAVSNLPLAGAGPATTYHAGDRPVPASADRPVADVRVVRGDYFRAMGIPLVEGRDFDRRDAADAPAVVVIDRAAAERWWPGESALGREIHVAWGDDRPRTVVGVVGSVHQVDLEALARDAVYLPHAQEGTRGMTLVVDGGPDAAALLPAVRARIAEVDPTLPLYDAATLAGVVGEASGEKRLLTAAVSLFALLALLLAAFGIFSISAFAVAERRREIGLRMALGATRGEIVRSVLRPAALLAAAALAVGVGLALATARWLEALLFGVTAADPWAIGGVVLALAAGSLLAAWGPARRAAAVAPVEALRLE